MNDEQLQNTIHYASVCYRRSCYGLYSYEDKEDYIQDFVLLALQNPNDGLPLIASKMRYKHKKPLEVYSILNALSFSSITDDNGELLPMFEELAYYDNYFVEQSQVILQAIANVIYPTKPERQEMFLTFCNGEHLPATKVRDLRDVIFNRRFEILKILLNYGVLSQQDYIKYFELAKNMTKRPRLPRSQKMTSSNIAQRAYYQRKKLQNATYNNL